VCVQQEAPFREILLAVQQRRAVRTVAVLDAEGIVVGTVSVRQTCEAMFDDLFPAAALGEVADLESALEVMDEMRHMTAGELMSGPAVAQLSDTVRDAFICLHRAHLTGLPVVDADGRPVGYLDHLDMVPIWLERFGAGDPSG
jgi:CBS domain-containing protein